MGKKLLLADDSVTIQKVIEITFADKDYQLQTADNGDEALAMAQQQRPDLILADVFMPGKNGYELCEAVRAVPELADVPVLLLAGTFEPFDEAKANAVGATSWITKPFGSQDLVDKVADMLANAPAGDTWKATPGQTPVESDILGAIEEVSAAEAARVSAEQETTFDVPLAPVEEEAPVLEPLADFAAPAEPAPEPVAETAFEQTFEPETTEEPDTFSFDAVTEYAPAIEPVAEEAPSSDLPPLSDFSFESNETPQAETVESAPTVDPFALPEAEEEMEEAPQESLATLDPFAVAEEAPQEDFVVEPPAVEEPEPVSDPFAELSPLDDFSASSDVVEPEAPSLAPLPELETPEEPEPAAELPPLVEEPTVSAPAAAVMDLSADAIVAEGAYGATPGRVETRVAYLSDEQLSEIVERVAGAIIEKLAAPMLEKVVWEVVPDLAESMVREEMAKIKPDA